MSCLPNAHKKTSTSAWQNLGPNEVCVKIFVVDLHCTGLKDVQNIGASHFKTFQFISNLKRNAFTRGACKSGQAFNGSSRHQSLVTAMNLCHSFLQKWHPQLVPLRLGVDQSEKWGSNHEKRIPMYNDDEIYLFLLSQGKRSSTNTVIHRPFLQSRIWYTPCLQ